MAMSTQISPCNSRPRRRGCAKIAPPTAAIASAAANRLSAPSTAAVRSSSFEPSTATCTSVKDARQSGKNEQERPTPGLATSRAWGDEYLEIELHAELHQPPLQNQRRRSPRTAEGVVLRQDCAAVQQVEEIESALDPRASSLEGFAQAHINLRESIAVQRPRRDQLRGLSAAGDRAAEGGLREYVAGVDRVVGKNLRPRTILQRRTGPDTPPGQRVADQAFDVGLERRLNMAIQLAWISSRRRERAGARGEHPC